VSALVAAVSSVLGFVFLALSHDRMIDRHDDPALGTRVSTRLGQAAGAICLLLCGAASVFQYGWGFGLVAWVGWLAVGAFVGVAVLAIAAALRGPLPRVSRRRKYRPNAADARDVPQ
jgi:peptidoglycan biosynthesis protein MviN/MurJ (putative lipid II flippase)